MNFLELPLFQSLSDQELEQMKTSSCLRTASYKKNDIISVSYTHLKSSNIS